MRFYYSLFSCLIIANWCSAQTLDQLKPDQWYNVQTPIFSSNSTSYSEPLIGNHRFLPSASIDSIMNRAWNLSDHNLSVFMVVNPLQQDSHNKQYLRMGGLTISDKDILFRGVGREFEYKQNVPIILSASFTKKVSESNSIVSSIDTSIFRLAELIVFNRRLSKEEIRYVESYLSLKFSIPTTRNEERYLRSYPGDSVGSYNWSFNADRKFNREVIALGNFNFSSLTQTQTLAYHEDTLVFSLDTVVPLGSQPSPMINEGGMIILSKKTESNLYYDCEAKLNNEVPMTQWRLSTKHLLFSSSDSLIIQHFNHPASLFLDSLILTDGLREIPLNIRTLPQKIHVSIPVDSLSSNRRYSFRVKGYDCLDSLKISDTPINDSTVLYSISKSESDTIFDLVVWHEESGLFVPQMSRGDTVRLFNGQNVMQIVQGQNEYENLINSDQNQVLLTVAGGDQIDNNNEDVELLVFPNPAAESSMTQIVIRNLSHKEEILLSVHDAQGRLNKKVRLIADNSGQVSYKIPHRQAGYFFVSVKGNQFVEVKKIVVTQD